MAAGRRRVRVLRAAERATRVPGLIAQSYATNRTSSRQQPEVVDQIPVPRRRRRRSGSLGYTPSGSVFLSPKFRRRRRGRATAAAASPAAAPAPRPVARRRRTSHAPRVVAALGGGAYYVAPGRCSSPTIAATAVVRRSWTPGSRATTRRCTRQLDASSRTAYPRISFDARYRHAPIRAARATQRRRREALRRRKDGTVTVPGDRAHDATSGRCAARSATRSTRSGKARGSPGHPSLRLPGLRTGEAVRRMSGPAPTRGLIYDASGRLLDSDPTGASIAGTPAIAGKARPGLQRIYDDAARPATRARRCSSATAWSAKVPRARRPLRPHDDPARAAAHRAERAGRQGSAASRSSARATARVLALAGLAVSAPQPPGSTFKIVTVAAALAHHVATPSSQLPGAHVRGAVGRDACATRAASRAAAASRTSFAESCNSVFAPLGARLGAKKLVAAAEAFGFNQRPRRPRGQGEHDPQATRPQGRAWRSARARSARTRDLATPLGMAVGRRDDRQRRRARPPAASPARSSATAPSAARWPARCAT